MRLHGLVRNGLVVIGLVACAACGKAVDPVQERSAIDETRNAYASAWRAADAAAVTALYTDDAVVLYPNQPAVAGKGAMDNSDRPLTQTARGAG